MHYKLIPNEEFVSQWKSKEWARSDWECLFLISIYFNSKFEVTRKNKDFYFWFIGTHTKEKQSKISNTEVIILLSFPQNTLIKLPSWVLWGLLFVIIPSDALKTVYSSQNKAKNKVRQSQVRYIYTMWILKKSFY